MDLLNIVDVNIINQPDTGITFNDTLDVNVLNQPNIIGITSNDTFDVIVLNQPDTIGITSNDILDVNVVNQPDIIGITASNPIDVNVVEKEPDIKETMFSYFFDGDNTGGEVYCDQGQPISGLPPFGFLSPILMINLETQNLPNIARQYSISATDTNAVFEVEYYETPSSSQPINILYDTSVGGNFNAYRITSVKEISGGSGFTYGQGFIGVSNGLVRYTGFMSVETNVFHSLPIYAPGLGGNRYLVIKDLLINRYTELDIKKPNQFKIKMYIKQGSKHRQQLYIFEGNMNSLTKIDLNKKIKLTDNTDVYFACEKLTGDEKEVGCNISVQYYID